MVKLLASTFLTICSIFAVDASEKAFVFKVNSEPPLQLLQHKNMIQMFDIKAPRIILIVSPKKDLHLYEPLDIIGTDSVQQLESKLSKSFKANVIVSEADNETISQFLSNNPIDFA